MFMDEIFFWFYLHKKELCKENAVSIRACGIAAAYCGGRDVETFGSGALLDGNAQLVRARNDKVVRYFSVFWGNFRNCGQSLSLFCLMFGVRPPFLENKKLHCPLYTFKPLFSKIRPAGVR